MKRGVLLSLLLLCTMTFAPAQDRIDILRPKDPRSMAMGGAFIAMSTGFQSLYGNPASFADKKVELTIPSITPWFYFSPTQENIDTLSSLDFDETDLLISSATSLITSNGIGGGASIGSGWVGKGLGIGIVGIVDTYLHGKNVLGAIGSFDGQIAGVFGIGVPVDIFGLPFSFGGDLRPFVRMTGEIGSKEIGDLVTGDVDPSEIFNNLDVDLGFGMAIDLGAKLDFGRFASVGLTIRDIALEQKYERKSLGAIFNESSDLGESIEVPYLISPEITLGGSMRPLPVGMNSILDLLLVLELQDPVSLAEKKATFWHLVHFGAEVEFLKGLLALRGGVNRGWVSMGVGLDLLFLELNAALFTEELGKRPGDRGRTGISMELTIRF